LLEIINKEFELPEELFIKALQHIESQEEKYSIKLGVPYTPVHMLYGQQMHPDAADTVFTRLGIMLHPGRPEDNV